MTPRDADSAPQDVEIANQRGDGFRELVREDTVRIEWLTKYVAALERRLPRRKIDRAVREANGG